MTVMLGILIGFGAWFFIRYVLAAFYTVDQNERAVKTIFGRAERMGRATTANSALGGIETASFPSAFAAFTAQRVDAVFVLSSPLVFPNQRMIADIAMKASIPTVCALREYALAGCFIAYGPKYVEHFRRAAEMIDRIFKGVKPADLPVEQPTRFELLVNLKTAKALRLSVQETFLLRADEVIE
jgi:ABC-type uncharacterized transport system substrate-binding protein